MDIFLFIALILAAISGCFLITRQFQMLQQNSYFPSRYANWLKNAYSPISALVFLVSSVLFAFELYLFQMIFVAVILPINIFSALSIQKKSIKKLVVTGRVKRLYTTYVLLLAVLIAVFAIFGNGLFAKTSASLVFLLSFISPISVFIVWALTLPAEKMFAAYYVSDAKKILKNHRNLKVVGITGSYGKTTSKFILTRILSEKFNVVCTPHSFNTPMGVVRTVRESLKPQTEIFVCEMGAKNVGDIKEICDIANPCIGMITSVGPQHLDTFKSVDNVFNTKFELACAVKQNNGKVFVNGDSKEIVDRINDKDFTVYGTNEKFHFSAKNITYGRFGSEFTVKLGDNAVKLSTKLLGLHSIINITGAAALAYDMGVGIDEIKFAVASLKPTEHRLELKSSVNGSLLIDDAYNANPEGCIEAVRVLGSFDGMKKVIITPGLIELGEKEYDCNYKLGLEASKYCDIMIFVGKNRSIPMTDAANDANFPGEKVYVAESFFEAMDIYKTFADSNTVVLIENDLPDNYLN